MPTQIQIGPEGNSKTVEVGDEFLKLSPEEQQHTVNDIAKQLGYTEVSGNLNPPPVTPQPPQGNGQTGWRANDILPWEHEYTTDSNGRMHDTGATRWALPGLITGTLGSIENLMTPPPVVDPNNPQAIQGINTMEEQTKPGITSDVMNAAMLGMKGAPAGVTTGEKVAALAPKTAETVTTEAIPEGLKAGTATGTSKQIVVPPKPIPNSPSTTTDLKASVTDQELEKFLNTQSVIAKAKVGEEGAKPVARVTGTMGGKEVKAKANITGQINGPLSVTAQLGDEKGAQLKLQGGKNLLTAAQQETSDSLANFGTKFEQSMALEGAKITPELKQAVSSFKPAIATFTKPEQAQAFTENLAQSLADKTNKSSVLDKIYEAWLNWGLFSGFKSHTANIAGNLGVNAYTSSLENGLTALISKVTGSGYTFHEVAQRAIGDMEGIGDALRATAESFKTEKGLFDTKKMAGGKEEYVPAFGGNLGRAIRLPTRALTAEDAFFKALSARQEINGLAVRQAYSEGLTGQTLSRRIVELKNNPTPEMVKAATDFARTQTFTNPLGKFAQRGYNFLQSHKLLRFLVPIYKTPINIFTYAMKRSPLAPMFKEVRDDLMFKNGGVARDQALARMTLGTALSGWAVHEAMKDNITGAGPADPAERAVWKKTHQPYSVRIGDQWYSYSRIEPFGTLLGAAADAQSLSSEMKDHEIGSVLALMSTIASRQLVNKTWLQGPANLAQAINNPKEYGPQYVQQMLGTIVPNIVATVAKANDPYMREIHSVMDELKSRVPGYRETLNMRRDSTGEPIMNEGGFMENLLSPIQRNAALKDPTIAEMLRLHAVPGRLEPKMMNVPLEQAEWDSYAAMVGKLSKNFADAIIANPQFKTWSDPLRKMALEDGFNKARDMGRDLTLAKFPDLVLRMAQDKAATARGLAAPATNTDNLSEPLPPLAPGG